MKASPKYHQRVCGHCGAHYLPATSRQYACSARCRLLLILDPFDGSPACWPWPKSVGANGYGQFAVTSKEMVGAHRATYEAFNGLIPGGLFVCHSCDNRQCVNPSHLFLGTHQENMQDMVSKGRHLIRPKRIVSGDAHWTRSHPERLMRKLSAEKVKEIFQADGSHRALASLYGVDHSTIGRIKRGVHALLA